MKARDYNEILRTIKDTNDMPKDTGKPIQQKLRASLIADYGLQDSDVKNLLNKMRWA